MPKIRISSLLVVLILLPSVYITTNLAIAYLEAALGKPAAQWQLEFIRVPISIFFALLALAIGYFSRASRLLIGACIIAFIVPCLLFGLVQFHAY